MKMATESYDTVATCQGLVSRPDDPDANDSDMPSPDTGCLWTRHLDEDEWPDTEAARS
jgi:hypothetical protein